MDARCVFLKSITLHGFKSFADRTEITFSDGITAIVGPNGCGKSNVLDAVRWVLGEQSAKSLRGARMLDVVFSGSRSRKPANFAEVSLRFDNRKRTLQSEADDVTVGRVLYRNGESEYRLNGEGCRLKDVRDLFLDTGVGVDAYSVIEQGRVDRLLQASPLERREIFEEAAGVSRYKVRRTEAQRKLERTQQNVLRLNDLIDELERQLRSVKLAAAKARKFQEHDGRLRELRSNFALAEYHGLQQSQAQIAERRSVLEGELTEARRELAAQDSDAAEHDRAIQRGDAKIQAAVEQLRSLETEIGMLAERAAQGEARIEELAATRGRRQAQSLDLSQRAELMRAQIAELSGDVQALVAKVEERSTKVDELQQSRSEAEARSDAVRRSLDAERVNLFEVARRTALLNNQFTNLTQQSQRVAASAARLDERSGQLQCERVECSARERGLAAQCAENEDRTAGLQATLRELDADLAALLGELRQVSNELSTCKEQRSALASRQELLIDLDRRREGIGEGARHVLAWAEADGEAAGGEAEGGSGGVLGVVADLLTVQDPRIVALQHVLARVERHVVVRNADEFFAELARRGGSLPAPVDIIALDRIVPVAEGADYGTVAGGVLRASEWVSCAAEYRGLAEWLLGRVFIVETRALALKRAERAPAGCVFVTPQGEVAAPGGQCTLGPLTASEGLISRKAEIWQLQEQLEVLERELGERQRRRLELDERASDVNLKREASLTETARLQREHAAMRTELARCEAEAQRITRANADLENERLELDRAGAELRAQLAELENEQGDVLLLRETHETRVAELSTEMNACEKSVALHSQQLTDALVEIGRQAEKRAAAEQSLRELKARITQLEHERAAADEEAAEAAQRVEELRSECADARRRHAQQVEQSGAVQAGLAELRTQRAELRRALDALGEQVRRRHAQIEELQGQAHACEAGQREMIVRQDNVVTRVREELGLDLGDLYRQYAHAEQDWDSIRGEIDELRGKIQRLGNVNLDAIAELDELTPRFDSLVAQRTDLIDSMARLTQLIADLDAESHKRFAEAFNEIRANFQDLFRKLFGGGRADVILEDPDRPLECGIEVIARPPGKEPQSISLLSGGEKTMTCVALLMAVFKSKPSPFAILDEVDAALDEANVERFSRLLHEFLAASQFVVITHNKKTMAAADVLYGVTMEEPGVSKHVSVRFDDRVHTPSVA